MVAREWKNLVFFVPSRASNQTGSFERRPPRSWSHLLDVDPVQRPHLLGRRGGFGFVVSVSLATETQRVDSPSSCFKKKWEDEFSMRVSRCITSSPNAGEGPQLIVLSSAAMMTLLFLQDVTRAKHHKKKSWVLHQEGRALHIITLRLSKTQCITGALDQSVFNSLLCRLASCPRYPTTSRVQSCIPGPPGSTWVLCPCSRTFQDTSRSCLSHSISILSPLCLHSLYFPNPMETLQRLQNAETSSSVRKPDIEVFPARRPSAVETPPQQIQQTPWE